MRKRDLVGRRIVDIEQRLTRLGSMRDPYIELVGIRLDNGAVIRFVVHEHDDGYGVWAKVVKPARKSKTGS